MEVYIVVHVYPNDTIFNFATADGCEVLSYLKDLQDVEFLSDIGPTGDIDFKLFDYSLLNKARVSDGEDTEWRFQDDSGLIFVTKTKLL